jgi:hypothetical protein
VLLAKEVFPGLRATPYPTFYSDMVRAAGAFAYWRLNEQSGTTFADSIGGVGALTLQGSGSTLGNAGVLQDSNEASLSLNGNGWARALLAADISTVDFTVEGWQFNTRAAGDSTNNGLASIWNTALGTRCCRLLPRTGGGGTDYYFAMNVGITEYSLQPTGAAGSSSNVWVHWAMTRAGTLLTVYRNGVNVGSRNDLPTSAVPMGAFMVGGDQYTGGNPMTGRVEAVAVYLRALSAAEVLTHYNAGLNGW